MPTIYDVFAEVVERAPCSAKDLTFTTPVYAHLKTLVKKGLLEKKGTLFTPRTTAEAKHTFEIIKYSLKKGLDYNVLFSKNMPTIIIELFTHKHDMRPKRLKNNQDITKTLNFLENNQFILLTKLRPRKGVILEHNLFREISTLQSVNTTLKQATFITVEEELKNIPEKLTNPFDEKIFEFLSGSAQLEGSTVTPGETKELILHDIYPDKPKKDIQMVKNLNEAMHYVLSNLDKEITPERIMEVNKLVLFSLHRNAGKYKKTDNKIQGNPSFKTANPREVPRKIQEYCNHLSSIKSKDKCISEIGRIHNELQHIHPFSDGNSRTTRMIVNWILLKHKLPLLVLKNGCFETYMSLTKLAKRRDDEKLKLLLHQALYHEHILSRKLHPISKK